MFSRILLSRKLAQVLLKELRIPGDQLREPTKEAIHTISLLVCILFRGNELSTIRKLLNEEEISIETLEMTDELLAQLFVGVALKNLQEFAYQQFTKWQSSLHPWLQWTMNRYSVAVIRNRPSFFDNKARNAVRPNLLLSKHAHDTYQIDCVKTNQYKATLTGISEAKKATKLFAQYSPNKQLTKLYYQLSLIFQLNPSSEVPTCVLELSNSTDLWYLAHRASIEVNDWCLKYSPENPFSITPALLYARYQATQVGKEINKIHQALTPKGKSNLDFTSSPPWALNQTSPTTQALMYSLQQVLSNASRQIPTTVLTCAPKSTITSSVESA